MIQTFPDDSSSTPFVFCVDELQKYVSFVAWVRDFEQGLVGFASEFCWPAGGWRRYPQGLNSSLP